MKTTALIPVVAYLGLAGFTSAAPVAIDAEKSLDKRFICIWGWGWGCSTPTTTSAAPAKTSAASSVVSSIAKQSAVTSSSAVKSSAIASSSAKASSAVAAPSSTSSAKSVATSTASKSSSASWAQCTDFDWSAWNDKEWTWGGGFSKDYVKDWYIAEYGLQPPPGMNWRQVSSLVSKFGAKTVGSGPKTTSKYSKGCSNPWTSAAPVTKTKAATTTTGKPVTPVPTSTKAAVTSAAASKSSSVASSSSASASKAAASSAAASLSSASKAAASSAAVSSSAAASSVAAGGFASSSASSAAAGGPAPSASSGAGSSSAASSSASSSPSASVPVVVGGGNSPSPSPSASSVSTDVPAASPSPATPSSSGSADGSNGVSTGTPGTGSGVPGTGAGLPGTGEGANNGTSTSVEQPQPTVVAPAQVNGYTYGGCAQEVAGRLLSKVQTSSASQTIESCTALCASYGFGVAGLEYGNECYCGTLEDTEDAELSGECYMPCAGNPDQTCGGPNAINWYYDADLLPPSVELPSGWTTYGVVTEGTNGRLLPTLLYASQDNTVEKCAQGCAAAGYKVAGTEYSAECFCGNGFTLSAGGGELVDDSAAFMSCSGNLAQKCGGPSILSITSAFGDDIPSI